VVKSTSQSLDSVKAFLPFFLRESSSSLSALAPVTLQQEKQQQNKTKQNKK
jgi:hypothetical protein